MQCRIRFNKKAKNEPSDGFWTPVSHIIKFVNSMLSLKFLYSDNVKFLLKTVTMERT